MLPQELIPLILDGGSQHHFFIKVSGVKQLSCIVWVCFHYFISACIIIQGERKSRKLIFKKLFLVQAHQDLHIQITVVPA